MWVVHAMSGMLKKKRFFISIYSKNQMQIASGNTLRQRFSISKRFVLEHQVQESCKLFGFVGLSILRGWHSTGHVVDTHLNGCNEWMVFVEPQGLWPQKWLIKSCMFVYVCSIFESERIHNIYNNSSKVENHCILPGHKQLTDICCRVVI